MERQSIAGLAWTPHTLVMPGAETGKKKAGHVPFRPHARIDGPILG